MYPLLFPPIAFLLILAAMYVMFKLILPAPSVAGDDEKSGKYEPYACGEDVKGEKVIPNYDQFFPFAIFFTMLHVAGLMIATWSFYPAASGFFPIAGYAASVLIILSILFTG